MELQRWLSLGAGVQSSTLLLLSLRGELPPLDGCIFADTENEPDEVYRHLEWLEGEAARGGVKVHRVSAGNIYEDSLDSRKMRKSADGKRYASTPLFVKNADGSRGRMPRQCTSEYKIEPIDSFFRKVVLNLKTRQRAPKDVRIEQWMGITDDEASRAKPPGVYKSEERGVFTDLFGNQTRRTYKVWAPTRWKTNTYPFLQLSLWPDRRGTDCTYLDRRWHRQDCADWLARNYPGRVVPRSACVICPLRSNAEWIAMRDGDPKAFSLAVEFDREARIREQENIRGVKGEPKKRFLGEVYLHSQLVPLDQVDFDGDGEQGGGCGTLFDGTPDGMCGL